MKYNFKGSIIIILAVFILFFSFSNQQYILYAQDEDVSSEEELLFKEIPIVITASKREQLVTEAPAVVTVISAKEIKQMGARNLMDVLKTVPGFNILQDSNEHLSVMRGVYASANQKFLVLRDGHRLNGWMWNVCEHDESLTLANVKRVEVIRGPGASIYGSAALTAVVNIITEDGGDIDGLKVNIGAGSPSHQKGDFVYGKRYDEDSDLMIFGSYYESKGERAYVPKERDASSVPINGHEYVDRRDPNYDIGLKLREGKFLFSASLRNSDYMNPRANSGQLIDWNIIQIVNYKQIFRTGHVNFLYEDKVFKDSTVKFRHYWDALYWYSWQLLKPEREYEPHPYPRMFYWDVEGYSYGLEYSISFPLWNGDILVGFQPEGRKLLDSTSSRNYSTEYTNTPALQVDSPIKEGGEYYLAGYIQAEHNVTKRLKSNFGLRYDYYKDVGGSVNPRLALIYEPFNTLFWKILYGKSFLNPSYFYRYVTGAMGYYGGPDLKPEIMNSYQTEISKYFKDRVVIKVGYFYNILEDLVAPDKSTWTYKNYGKITINGVETETKIKIIRAIAINANHTYQKPIENKTDESRMKDGAIQDVPTHTANCGINCAPFKILNLNLSGNYHSKIESPATGEAYGDDYEIPPVTILNFVVILHRFWHTAEITLKIHNLLNKEYYLGGTTIPYRQAGRWVFVNLGYKF